MTAKIAVVGSLNMDLIVQAPRIPGPGETILGAQDLVRAPGGKGANQAHAAALLGAQVSMIGRVGGDDFGSQLLDSLKAAGADISNIHRDPAASTGVALIVVDSTGQNSIVVSSGANKRLSPEDIEAAKDTIIHADVLLLQLETPIETVRYAAQVAAQNNVTVVLNPAPARHLPEDLLRLVDVMVPNESEALLLAGMSISDNSRVHDAAASLRKLGVRALIVTMGGKGAALILDEGMTIYPTIEVPPVDTTGAGDAFSSALSVALAEGKSLADAIRFGNIAGALSVTKLGAQTSMPLRAEVEDLLSSNT